jgi:Family of unknown function (DUF6158)
MPHRYGGVAAPELEDEDLRKELRSLHRTREDTFLNGSKQSLEEHTERMMELEGEFLRRFPKETRPAAQRTRVGARTGRAPAGTKRKPQRSTTRS